MLFFVFLFHIFVFSFDNEIENENFPQNPKLLTDTHAHMMDPIIKIAQLDIAKLRNR